eukprot:102739_1
MESSKVGVPPLSNHKHDGRDAIDDLSTIKAICHRACFQDIHAFVFCDHSPLWCIQPRLHHPKVNNIEAYHSNIISKDRNCPAFEEPRKKLLEVIELKFGERMNISE